MSLIKLPYLGSSTYGEQNNSPSGYSEIQGIDKYDNAYTRNVRIVRIDLLSNLEDHFTLEIIAKYRSVIYYILAGYGTKDKSKLILQSLEQLYKEDEVFKIKLGKLFYFRDTNLEGISLYDALIKDVKSSIEQVRTNTINKVPHVKVICESHLYLYLSVSNLTPIQTLVQFRGLEVISR